MNETAQAFSVMVKPVGSHCNLRCRYCYYLKTDRSEHDLQKAKMTNELLGQFIRQHISASPGPEVSFVWHGGEPTLAGLDFYRDAVRFQQKHLPEGWICWNNLQTNGLLLDDQWCAFLAEAGFDVGLSIDGTEKTHDYYRLDNNANGTWKQAIETVRRLQKHGIQPDLLCTVNASTEKNPLDVYQALQQLNTGWIQFIPVVSHDQNGVVDSDSVSGEGFGDFLLAVFDQWSTHDLGSQDVQIFAEMSRILTGGAAGLCWMAPTCGRALIVEVDGGVYCCDHYVNDDHRLGNLLSDELGELANSTRQLRFGNTKQDSLAAECLACPWLRFCNGGCPKDRFIPSVFGKPDLNYLCAGLKRFFAYAEPIAVKILQLSQQGFSAATIMDHVRQQRRDRWVDVGRNDPCPCGSERKAKNCCWTRRP
jgi:uncharacterized protein